MSKLLRRAGLPFPSHLRAPSATADSHLPMSGLPLHMENPTRTRSSRRWDIPMCFLHSPAPRTIITADPLSYLENLMMTEDGTLITTTTRVLPLSATMNTTHEREPLPSSPRLNPDLLPASATTPPTPVAPLPRFLPLVLRRFVPLPPDPPSLRLPLPPPRPLKPMPASIAFLLDTHSRTGILPRSLSYSSVVSLMPTVWASGSMTGPSTTRVLPLPSLTWPARCGFF